MKRKLALFALFCGLSLTACVEDLQLAEGGMTGTGMTAGRITGFGSIYVNGIHYNVDDAQFYRDSTSTTEQSDFSVGEYVTITGSEVVDGEAIATRVSFESLIRGIVTVVSTDGIHLKVMGQTITTDELSIFHGFETLSALSLGNLVEISGTRNANNDIVASSITLLTQQALPNSNIKLEGTLQNLSIEQKIFSIGDLSIDYSAAHFREGTEKDLSNAVFVSVRSEQTVENNQVFATQVTFKNKRYNYDNNKHIEIEGHITRFETERSFELNNQAITTDNQTVFEGITAEALALDMSIEVEGMINDQGTLEADKITSRQTKINRIKMDGNLTSIDLNNNSFVLNEKRFFIDNTSILLGKKADKKKLNIINLSSLKAGDYVDIEAILLRNARYKVLRLDLDGRKDHFSSKKH